MAEKTKTQRDKIIDSIRAGYSVPHAGGVWTKESEVPDEATVAQGNLPELKLAEAALREQAKQIDEQLKRVQAEIKTAESA